MAETRSRPGGGLEHMAAAWTDHTVRRAGLVLQRLHGYLPVRSALGRMSSKITWSNVKTGPGQKIVAAGPSTRLPAGQVVVTVLLLLLPVLVVPVG